MADHLEATSPGSEDGGYVRRVDEVTAALEQLSDILTDDDGLPMMLRRLCHQAVRAIPSTDFASVSLVHDGTTSTAASTDDRATQIDLAQYSAGEGPCLQSAATGEVVRVTVAEARRNWPDFVTAAQEAAVASYLSAPLFIDSEYHGSLNLYSETPHGYGSLDAALVELYTTSAESALRTTRRYLDARELASQLREALNSRAVIDQAKGVIMAVRRVSAAEAFTVLVNQSQAENVKVRDLAERLLANILDGHE